MMQFFMILQMLLKIYAIFSRLFHFYRSGDFGPLVVVHTGPCKEAPVDEASGPSDRSFILDK